MDTAEFVAHFRSRFPDLVEESILVALSGGCDSVSLLHLLRAEALGLTLAAAHVHHGLRGAEADADAAFCSVICRELGIPCEILHLRDDNETPATGEAAWRRRRYRVLHEHAASLGVSAVTTAHHRDDVAEGVLLQLLRGAGPRAMAGIEERSSSGVIRPLLPWGRDEISAWAADHGIAWREDGSNTDVDRLRNRVRHRVLPLLEERTPRLRDHLVHIAGAMAETEAFMAAELAERAAFIDPWHPNGGVDVAVMRELPGALSTRWLQAQTHLLGVGGASRRQLTLFRSLLEDGVPRSVTLGDRWRLRVARGRIWAEPPQSPPGRCAALVPGRPTELGVPGWWASLSAPSPPESPAVWRWRPHTETGIVTVRPASDEDRLPTAGRAGRRVRELLAEKLPRHLRRGWPVFCEDDMIHWIPGVWQNSLAGDPSNRVVEVFRR